MHICSLFFIVIVVGLIISVIVYKQNVDSILTAVDSWLFKLTGLNLKFVYISRSDFVLKRVLITVSHEQTGFGLPIFSTMALKFAAIWSMKF